MAAAAIDKQQIILSDDHDEKYTLQSWVHGARSEEPLLFRSEHQTRALGVLGLFRRQNLFSNSEEILSTLENIGWQAGVSVENALLFQQVNEYTNTLQAKVNARTAEIQKQKEQTDAILESAADSIIIISSQGHIDYINPAFTNMTGYVLDNVKKQALSTLISDQTPPQKIDQLQNAIRAGTTWHGDIKSRRKDGSVFLMPI